MALSLKVVNEDYARGPDYSPNCEECPFAGSKPVPAEGPTDPLFIAVGEGPGGVEVREGRPFVGPSGELLEDLLSSNGVQREDIWLTNATLCIPKGRKKTQAEVDKAKECCRPRLEAELGQLDPDAPVLALGGPSSRTFLGNKFKISEFCGSYHEVEGYGEKPRGVIPTHHPAKILRGAESSEDRGADLLVWSVVYDIGKVAALGEGQDLRFTDDVEIEYEDPARALELVKGICREAHREREAAIDVETDSVYAYGANLTAIAIGTSKRAVSVSYDLMGPEIFFELKKLCESELVTKVFHNLIFDMTVLERYGVYCLGRVEDTLLLDHAAFPGASHKLQEVTARHYAVTPWKAEFRKGEGSIEELLTYNARDTLATARIRHKLVAIVDGFGKHLRDVYELDLECARVAQGMGSFGIPIDWRVNRELHKHCKRLVDRAKAEIQTYFEEDPDLYDAFVDELSAIMALKQRVSQGDPDDIFERIDIRYRELRYGVRQKKDPSKFLQGKEPVVFNIGNQNHVAAFLKARGHTLTKFTATGKPSTAKDALEKLHHLPEVKSIQLFREMDKLDSTFVRGVKAEGYGRWKRVHPLWSVHKISGRWSNRGFGQNWPKDNPKGRPNFRRSVVAPPGRLLVGADFDKLEARLIALASGDKLLCDMLMGRGGCSCGGKFCPKCDLHTALAAIAFPTFFEFDKASQKDFRDLTKRAEYGSFYGADVETIWQTLCKEMPDMPIRRADVEELYSKVNEGMPGVEAWHRELIRQAVQDREIRSIILGRPRRFPLGNVDRNVIYNHPIQAGGADLMNLAIVALAKRLPETARIVLQVHDAVVVECDEEDAWEVKCLIEECMTQTHTINGVTMHFPAEAEIGESWMRTDGKPSDKAAEKLAQMFAEHLSPEEYRPAIRWLFEERIDPEFVTVEDLYKASEDGPDEPVPIYGAWRAVAPKILEAAAA